MQNRQATVVEAVGAKTEVVYAALAANVAVRFAVNNTFVDSTDEVSVWIVNPVNPSAYDAAVDAVVSGLFVIRLRNNTSTSYSDSVVLGFAVRKAATS